MENVKGTLERVTYHNKDSGFCVLQVQVEGQANLICMVGVAHSLSVGEAVVAHGDWHIDKIYGKQFKAQQLQFMPPSNIEGVEKYLASGVVKGIGQHYAKLLVNAFGESVFDVIENHPERLNHVAGIGKKRKALILSGWTEQTSIRRVMVFLQSLGMGTTRAAKIYKRYGEQALEIIRENPYRLIQDIPSIGFKIADSLAEKLAIPRDSMLRACAGLHYTLLMQAQEGHCAVLETDLLNRANEILEIDKNILIQAVASEIQAGKIVLEVTEQGNTIFLLSLYQAEDRVARDLQRLLKGQLPWGNIDVANALPWVEEQTGLALSASQRTAITAALQSKIFIITGGPGVGKTTVVKSLLTILRAKRLQVALCAPTGRAAKRLTETTKLTAKTIHRLLEYDPHARVFQHNEFHPLAADLVIVDEASMLDIELMRHLLAAIPDHAAVFFIGDIDQLPSVGPGAVLNDLIASQKIPTAALTEIFRQAEASRIIQNAHRINHGQMPLPTEKGQLTDFYFLNVDSPDAICNTIVELVTERIPQRFDFHPLHDIQVLTPMNRGGVGTRVLNNLLQKKMNGLTEPKMTRFEWTFAPRDKVIQIVNNYDKDVFNGDIGQVASIDIDKGILKVNYEGRLVTYATNELDELALAYAMSIHKSQGSEYPVVVIALAAQHQRMLVRNLLYTAVTRGKELVIIVGQAQALTAAINTVQTGQRLTRLNARIVNSLS